MTNIFQRFLNRERSSVLPLIFSRTKAQYEAILARVDQLVEMVDDNTPKTDKRYVEMDLLADLIVEYEKQNFDIGKKNPKCERILVENEVLI